MTLSPNDEYTMQTPPSMPGLSLIFDDAVKRDGTAPDNNDYCSGIDSDFSISPGWSDDSPSPLFEEDDGSYTDEPTSSPMRRNFAQYKRRQLRGTSDEIGLGWDCGICLETAEDPCVTHCGHLYCQAHLTHWLSTQPSCPGCGSVCTIAQDVVPIFPRARTPSLPSPISLSPPSSSLSSQDHSRTPSPNPPSTFAKRETWANISANTLVAEDTVPQEPQPLPPPEHNLRHFNSNMSVHPHPHPLMKSYVLAHYLGLVLRVLGLAMILGVLLH